MKNQKPNWRAIAIGFGLALATLFVCYILTGLALISAGYPMWN